MSNTPEIDEVEKYSGVTIKDSVTTCGDESSSVYIPVIFARQLERERDKAREQLESTKMRMKAEQTAAREAIDAAEVERDKAYGQFYQNPDAAKHEREKAERQNAEWQEKWQWSSNAFAQLIKKNEQLEEEISKLKSEYE
jgi:hypothetical protein